MQTILVTNCCKAKKPTPGLLKARDRYLSQRIQSLYQQAQAQKMPCYILSGKFGLIHSEAAIPYYDHLLQFNEVEQHAQRVATQILELRLEALHFVHRPLDSDPNLRAYVLCLKKACQLSQSRLSLREYSEL